MKRATLSIVVAFAFLVGVGARAEGETPDPTYVGSLRPPASGDRFHRPAGITADLHTGEVFVCDSRGNRIVIFDSQGLYRYQILGGSLFRSPLDVAVDPEGYLFVATVTGGKRTLFHLDFDGAPVGEVDLSRIEAETGRTPEVLSVAITPKGDRLFVVDGASQRLWTLTREGGVLGSADLIPDVAEDKRDEQILGKVDVYGDRVLVAVSTQGRVHLYDLDGNELGRVGRKGSGPCQTSFPVAAAMDENGDVWILDLRRAMFMRWRLQGNQCLGQHYGFGNAAGAMYSPLDIALDAHGTIYVTQGFESRVQFYEGAPPAAGAPASARPLSDPKP